MLHIYNDTKIKICVVPVISTQHKLLASIRTTNVFVDVCAYIYIYIYVCVYKILEMI